MDESNDSSNNLPTAAMKNNKVDEDKTDENIR